MNVFLFIIDQVKCHEPGSELSTDNQTECNGYAVKDATHSSKDPLHPSNGPVHSAKESVHPSHTTNDPVHDVCPDLKVKIADLGNACWEVSMIVLIGPF